MPLRELPQGLHLPFLELFDSDPKPPLRLRRIFPEEVGQRLVPNGDDRRAGVTPPCHQHHLMPGDSPEQPVRLAFQLYSVDSRHGFF